MDFIEVKAKTVKDAVTDALVQLEATNDQIEYEVISEGSSGFLGFNSKPAIIKVRKKEEEDPKDRITGFLSQVFATMNMDIEIFVEKSEEENVFDVNLKGEETGTLIGKRGQTLDSLQYLTNLVINKNRKDYIKIKLDTENYRLRRQKTLENLAKNIARKVKQTRKPVELEPMNPFERRIIHCALQDDRYVTTYSEGESPYRYVVIALKKEKREYNKEIETE